MVVNIKTSKIGQTKCKRLLPSCKLQMAKTFRPTFLNEPKYLCTHKLCLHKEFHQKFFPSIQILSFWLVLGFEHIFSSQGWNRRVEDGTRINLLLLSLYFAKAWKISKTLFFTCNFEIVRNMADFSMQKITVFYRPIMLAFLWIVGLDITW